MLFRRILTWILAIGFFAFLFLMYVAPLFPIFNWVNPLTSGDGAFIIFFLILLLASLLSLAQLIDLKYEIKEPGALDHVEVPPAAKPVASNILLAAVWYKIIVSLLFMVIAVIGLYAVITR